MQREKNVGRQGNAAYWESKIVSRQGDKRTQSSILQSVIQDCCYDLCLMIV